MNISLSQSPAALRSENLSWSYFSLSRTSPCVFAKKLLKYIIIKAVRGQEEEKLSKSAKEEQNRAGKNFWTRKNELR